MTAENDWLQRVANIRAWSKGGVRAPHKPLLLLYALGRLQRLGSNAPTPYAEAEKPLDALLAEFGPPHPTTSVYPFHHLTSDGLWVVKTSTGEGSPGATKTAMRQATGELAPDFAAALLDDPDLHSAIAHHLLDDNFPQTLHQDICDAVGLDFTVADETAKTITVTTTKKKRDPEFRAKVLMAYEKACAICGFDAVLDGDTPGLEAAHVRWFNIDGPDEVSNGLCLCSLHHKLFDKGAVGLTPEHFIAVSARFIAKSEATKHFVLSLVGKPISEPQAGFDSVADQHITWHGEQVFKGPARQRP
jgi:putative restriction endonuclease